MAAPTPTTVILQQDREQAVIKINIPEGGDADVTATTVADVSALSVGGAGTSLTIERVISSLSGFSVTLFFDASADVEAITLAEGVGDLDLREFGGIPNNAGSGVTGDIQMTTNGLSAATEAGTVIMVLRKV